MNSEIEVIDGLKLISNNNSFCLIILNKKGSSSVAITEEIYKRFVCLKNLRENNDSKKEIERKFLIKDIPLDLKGCCSSKIEQFYLIRDDITFSSLRIRRVDNTYFLTFKSGKGVSRIEEEFEICNSDFVNCSSISISHKILKTRIKYPIDKGLVAEIDFFHGIYSGKIFVGVKFSSEEEANNFSSPSWFGKDVTNEKEFLNITMAFSQKIHRT